MLSVNPYLSFSGNTEEAFEFYKTVFGGDFLAVVRYKDMKCMSSDDMPENDRNKIAHISLPLINGSFLMGSDSAGCMGEKLAPGNNVYIMLEAESAQEAERLFDGLTTGGKTEMPLQETEWAEKFGSCADKYGIRWMINFTGTKKL